MRDFGVFMALLMFPIFLVVFGITAAIQRVIDFTAGFIPLFPADIINGGGLVFSLIGCTIMVAVGLFVFWAAMPLYREYLNG
jgi:hypothetical protein